MRSDSGSHVYFDFFVVCYQFFYFIKSDKNILFLNSLSKAFFLHCP